MHATFARGPGRGGEEIIISAERGAATIRKRAEVTRPRGKKQWAAKSMHPPFLAFSSSRYDELASQASFIQSIAPTPRANDTHLTSMFMRSSERHFGRNSCKFHHPNSPEKDMKQPVGPLHLMHRSPFQHANVARIVLTTRYRAGFPARAFRTMYLLLF